MFRKLMKYRFLCQLRSKESIFWVLMFPIILSILFYAALSDINKGETFETIHIAVVRDELAVEDQIMNEVLQAVSVKDEENATKDTMFIIDEVSEEKAKKMLKNEDIAAYLMIGTDLDVVIKQNGMEQTIVKTFFDTIVQKENIINNIVSKNGEITDKQISEIMGNANEYIKDAGNRRGEPDTSLYFFYTILGMTCMYGASSGCGAIENIQTNQSSIAKRNAVAPVGKMKLFLSSFIVDMFMNGAIVLIVVSFIRFVLNVDFGDRYGLIVLTSVVGATMGLSFGYFFGAVTKKSMAFKSNMVIGISMICSFLAGMMSNEIKYQVQQNAYIVDRLNPVNLITESYYKLYYYTKLDKFYENIAILLAMTAFFMVGTVVMLNLQERNTLKERGDSNVF